MDTSIYWNADGVFDNVPNFYFNDGKVKFDANKVENVNQNFGSASGFLSKSLLIRRRFTRRKASFYSLEALIQPPSMRPISSISSSNRV